MNRIYLWTLFLLAVGISALTAWMTRYSVEPGPEAWVFIHDRWTGDVAMIVPNPTVRVESSRGGYAASAVFSMKDLQQDLSDD